MRLIDAEPIEKFIENGLNKKNPAKRFGHDAIEILTEIHYAPTIVPQPNPPLTLEELREMDGEPVWVKCIEPEMGHLSCWGIRNSGFIEGYKTDYYDSGFGNTWLAYRRKPEEGKT